MSNKTFLQDLESIKRKINIVNAAYRGHTDELDVDIIDGLNSVVDDIQQMINQCIEIQLMMTKEDKTKNFYKKRDK